MTGIGKQYGVFYADPPWRLEPYSDVTGMDRAAANHYTTMPLDEIKALCTPSAKDAVLFPWATSPVVSEALEVMCTGIHILVSRRLGERTILAPCYWTRNQHELLLIGTRGSIPAPAQGEQGSSLIRSAARAAPQKARCLPRVG